MAPKLFKDGNLMRQSQGMDLNQSFGINNRHNNKAQVTMDITNALKPHVISH
jgi:hypothetical protein